MKNPHDNPDYDRIYTILNTAKIEATNVVVDILRENERLQTLQVDPERYAKLENLLDLVSDDIEWQELHRADSPKFKPLITLYRELRPKEEAVK
jgi:hypothetical protein